MGLFRPSRESQAAARKTLWLRIVTFVTGAILALIGIATETSWLIYAAVGVLAVGIALRLTSRPAS